MKHWGIESEQPSIYKTRNILKRPTRVDLGKKQTARRNFRDSAPTRHTENDLKGLKVTGLIKNYSFMFLLTLTTEQDSQRQRRVFFPARAHFGWQSAHCSEMHKIKLCHLWKQTKAGENVWIRVYNKPVRCPETDGSTHSRERIERDEKKKQKKEKKKTKG